MVALNPILLLSISWCRIPILHCHTEASLDMPEIRPEGNDVCRLCALPGLSQLISAI